MKPKKPVEFVTKLRNPLYVFFVDPLDSEVIRRLERSLDGALGHTTADTRSAFQDLVEAEFDLI